MPSALWPKKGCQFLKNSETLVGKGKKVIVIQDNFHAFLFAWPTIVAERTVNAPLNQA